MIVGALAIFLVLLDLDKKTQFSAFLFFSFLEPLSPSGARVILSTIAGSMITVAGTVFSITIVTLTLASTQFGPRIHRNFMQSTMNQVVLGSYIATFIYCLCALGSVGPAEQESFVPTLLVNFALVLALINVGVLVFFIHHVATSIQMEAVISNIGKELNNSIEQLFPEKSVQQAENISIENKPERLQDVGVEGTALTSEKHGYLQAIDIEALAKIACDKKVVIRLKHKPGSYITRGMPLLCTTTKVEFDADVKCRLRDAFLLGPHRTSEQDIEYSIDQLVEIAIRALSPGVNDPFTALACIDSLETAICQIMERGFPSAEIVDEAGSVVVVAKTVGFSDILKSAFDQIRQHSDACQIVIVRLLKALHTCIALCEDASQRECLKQHAVLVHRLSQSSISDNSDKQEAEDQFQSILRLF